MEETKNENSEITEVIEEIKNADEETLRETIEKWFEQTRTSGMKIGAFYIASAVNFAIRKNLGKPGKSSLNDYKRCIKDISRILDVQLKTEQNDSEENVDDGTAETNDNPNS